MTIAQIDRRHFIGGSDARVIMGQDEKALDPPVAGESAARSRPQSPFLCLAKSHPGATAVFLNELNTGRFNRFLQSSTRFVRDVRSETSFQALNGRNRQIGSQGEFGLRQSQERTRGTELFVRDHV